MASLAMQDQLRQGLKKTAPTPAWTPTGFQTPQNSNYTPSPVWNTPQNSNYQNPQQQQQQAGSPVNPITGGFNIGAPTPAWLQNVGGGHPQVGASAQNTHIGGPANMPAWLRIAQQQMGGLRFNKVTGQFQQGAPAPQNLVNTFAGADQNVTNGIGLTTPGAPQGHNLDNHTFTDKNGGLYTGVTQQADGTYQGVDAVTGNKVTIAADGTVNVIPNNNGPYMLPQLGNYAPWYFSSLKNPPQEQPQNYWGSTYGGWGGGGGGGGGGGDYPAWYKDLMGLNSWNIG